MMLKASCSCLTASISRISRMTVAPESLSGNSEEEFHPPVPGQVAGFTAEGLRATDSAPILLFHHVLLLFLL